MTVYTIRESELKEAEQIIRDIIILLRPRKINVKEVKHKLIKLNDVFLNAKKMG